ncbi:hypothetical protein TRFO_35084 [Tritrichomonas foetus]|uniref:ZIP Zinc transporter family protein n=1 Tax=Tritrichomonas foetus TaxID=1144522 RepID=A0A1J4JH70_9EUKA|nr:hypothetical protein TRFO_35084 [Tritrichomonas foetus]|eukprot:OHS98490.1 hypothetical protein TRFO_35084 [Tritrichomonas foetus]
MLKVKIDNAINQMKDCKSKILILMERRPFKTQMGFFKDWAKYVCAFGIFVASIAGAGCSFCGGRQFAYFYGESLYTGIFISIAFLHLIPQYISNGSSQYDTSSIVFTALLLLFFVYELFSRNISKRIPTSIVLDGAQDDFSTASQMQTIIIPYLEHNGHQVTWQMNALLCTKLIASSCLIGLAMGITNIDDTIFMMLLAVALHKFLEALALGTRILARFSKFATWAILILFSLLTPAATLVVNHFLCDSEATTIAVCNAVSAAFFVYLGLSHWQRLFFCPYEYSRGELIGMTVLFSLGIVIVSVAAIKWSKN